MDRTGDVVVEESSSIVNQLRTGRTGRGKHQLQVKCYLGNESRSGMHRTLQERLETSAGGRALISFGLIVTLAAILVVSMPDSIIKSHFIGRAQAYLTAVGLGQDWGMFAPNPRTDVIYATGHILYSDGTSSVWSFPVRTGLLAYSDYRWQKFEEHVRMDNHQGLWQPFAQYLANHESTPGHEPVKVALMRRWAEIQPPGVTPELGRWKRYVYYVMPLEEAK